MSHTLPIALQLYSVRKDAKEDLRGLMQQVASWGYDGVEFAGLHGHDAPTVRRWLDEFGLACPSTHTPVNQLDEEHLQQTLADHQALGCDTIIVPALPEDRRNTLAACAQTAAWLNDLLAKLRAVDMRLGFHLHFADLVPLAPPTGDGRCAWDILAELTDDDFLLQYDTANGMSAGTDPVAGIRANPGRSVMLHLKEFGDGTHRMRGREGHGHGAIGEGDVDWPAVFDAAEQTGGTQWYIVEQEGHARLNDMEAAHLCLTKLQRLLAGRG